MPIAVRLLLVALALVAAVWSVGRARTPPAPALAGPPAIDERARAATFSFDPAVAGGDRDLVLSAVARARPEARALIGEVDGLVDLRVGVSGGAALGTTRTGGPRYLVTLDLATAYGRLGERGVTRLVLHELGHVVDAALVDRDLAARLDAGIPRGWGCDAGRSGACAAREERFAESFAKWATGDIGVGLSIGYAVPPPGPSLEAWGRPLGELARVRPAA